MNSRSGGLIYSPEYFRYRLFFESPFFYGLFPKQTLCEYCVMPHMSCTVVPFESPATDFPSAIFMWRVGVRQASFHKNLPNQVEFACM